MTGLGIGKETEPGTIGSILAAFEALKLILGCQNIQMLTIGALPGDETLEIVAVSRIWKADKKKCNCKKRNHHLQID